jgi:MSHA pilin protein MshC
MSGDGETGRGAAARSLPFPGRCQRGLSLVELILVMVIAGILAAVAVPRMVGRTSFDTRGFADQLSATVRFAQKLAVAQRTNVFVRLTASDATLCYDAACATPAPGPGGEKPYTITAPGGVAIAPAMVLGFNAGGVPDIGTQLAIQVNGSGTHNVLVEQETGYVHD